MSATPAVRRRQLNQAPLNPGGDYVLYWMIAARRVSYNFGLQRAAELCRQLDRPLVILEALRLDYPWASRRLHAFVMQGMAHNRRALAASGAVYHPYLEPDPGAGRGLLEHLAKRACAVITDDYPCFFLPRMLAAAAGRLGVRLEAVDSCGLLPLAATPKAFNRALDMRRFMQRHLPEHLAQPPLADPLVDGLPLACPLPPEILERWPATPAEHLARPELWWPGLALAADPGPVELAGGGGEARARLARFLAHGLDLYDSQHSQPLSPAASGLSPYLHFGHIGSHEVFLELARQQDWAPHLQSPGGRGGRQGFWGMSPAAEAFLDQLVTWRELGYHFCLHRPDHDQYASLPDWARATLETHAGDQRPWLYGIDEFLNAATHDPLWNAAQRQLLREGVMANYPRMLWGKKILHWSADPAQALAIMLELNNRLALDGRDPNSHSGIFWCLGRFDRPWGPERPVFGKVRYMSSRNTLRKLKLAAYLARYGQEGGPESAAP